MGNRLGLCFDSDEARDVPLHGLASDDHLFESPLTRLRTDIHRDFSITSDVLGKGWSGKVYRADSRNGGDSVAVKRFRKRKLCERRLALLQNEVKVYLRCDHPNICRLQHVYESGSKLWLVMDICGCDLRTWISEQFDLQERDAAKVMVQIVQAVKYLHRRNIVHRDLKPENWLHGRDGQWKLIDFGFARVLRHAGEQLSLHCGTLQYMSPEVLARRCYSSPCDMWSVGVIGHLLLRGRLPFSAWDAEGLRREIAGGADLADDDAWGAVSSDGRHFVRRLLQEEPERRADASEALGHPWLVGDLASRALLPNEVGHAGVLRQLRSFVRGPGLRQAALTMLAHSLPSQELLDLQQAFFSFDTDGAGTIAPDQFAQALRMRHPEYSPQGIEDICARLGHARDSEVHYTTFVAALLAPRAHTSEVHVRQAFNAFDPTGSGFITAEGLMRTLGLPRECAERWVREVDCNGNGAIGYGTFAAALAGWAGMRLPGAGPVARITDHGGRDVIPSFGAAVERRGAQRDARPQSFSPGDHGTTEISLGSVRHRVDGRHFY